MVWHSDCVYYNYQYNDQFFKEINMNIFWKDHKTSSKVMQNEKKHCQRIQKKAEHDRLKLMAMFYGVDVSEKDKKRG